MNWESDYNAIIWEISRFKNASSNFVSSRASPFLPHNFHSWCYSLSSPCNIGLCTGYLSPSPLYHDHVTVHKFRHCSSSRSPPLCWQSPPARPCPRLSCTGGRQSLPENSTSIKSGSLNEHFIFFVTLLGTRRCLPRRCGVLYLSASSQTLHLHLSCKCWGDEGSSLLHTTPVISWL